MSFSRTKKYLLTSALLIAAPLFSPAAVAKDRAQEAAVVTGVTVGNALFIPIKAITVSMGLMSGALSYIVSGGNAELTRQIWQDVTRGPYLVTPEVARKAVGERPELKK